MFPLLSAHLTSSDYLVRCLCGFVGLLFTGHFVSTPTYQVFTLSYVNSGKVEVLGRRKADRRARVHGSTNPKPLTTDQYQNIVKRNLVHRQAVPLLLRTLLGLEVYILYYHAMQDRRSTHLLYTTLYFIFVYSTRFVNFRYGDLPKELNSGYILL